MPKKEKIEIIIDEEDACDNFGEDTFQENIIRFVEEGYKHTYEEIKEAEFFKDHAKMKITTHTLKTTARYMSSENFAQICQGIEHETKAPNWDKIIELLPEFYEYYEILYSKTLKIYNRLKGKNPDDDGPIENNKENMIFWEREQSQIENKEKEETNKAVNENLNNLNQIQNNTNDERKNTDNVNNNLNNNEHSKLTKQFNFEPNFINKEDTQDLINKPNVYSLGEKNEKMSSNFNKIELNEKDKSPINPSFEKNEKFSLRNSFTLGKDNLLFNPDNKNQNIDNISNNKDENLLKISNKNKNENYFESKNAKEEFFDKNVKVDKNEIKHLEENLKGQNISHNEIFPSSKNTSTISANDAANVNMKNSIRCLREFDKQGGNIYFKNTVNYGDESMTNADFKSMLFFLLKLKIIFNYIKKIFLPEFLFYY